MRKKIFTYTVSALLLASLIATSYSLHAHAAAGNFIAPFDNGSAWNICQGYNNSRGTHVGANALSLDITGGPACDNSATGRNIRAPFAGKIAWYVGPSGSICVNSLDNKSIMITHIDSEMTTGTIVGVNQIIGSIAGPFQRQNNGVAHAHLQAWTTPNCGYSGGLNTAVPFDEIHTTRMCGLPDMTVDGPNPYNNGIWSGTSFITESCGTANPPVYRLYNYSVKKHVYTSDNNEAVVLKNRGWNYEGISYRVKDLSNCGSGESVYRFYSQQLQTHLYTIDENEKNYINSNFPKNIWSYEGVSFCASSTQTSGMSPVYRFYSEQLKTHLYTIDENEKNTIIGWNNPTVWKYEGVSYYATKN